MKLLEVYPVEIDQGHVANGVSANDRAKLRIAGLHLDVAGLNQNLFGDLPELHLDVQRVHLIENKRDPGRRGRTETRTRGNHFISTDGQVQEHEIAFRLAFRLVRNVRTDVRCSELNAHKSSATRVGHRTLNPCVEVVSLRCRNTDRTE